VGRQVLAVLNSFPGAILHALCIAAPVRPGQACSIEHRSMFLSPHSPNVFAAHSLEVHRHLTERLLARRTWRTLYQYGGFAQTGLAARRAAAAGFTGRFAKGHERAYRRQRAANT
jgi:hypothetical protein